MACSLSRHRVRAPNTLVCRDGPRLADTFARAALRRTPDFCSTVAHCQWRDFDARTPVLGPPSALSLIREMVSFGTGAKIPAKDALKSTVANPLASGDNTRYVVRAGERRRRLAGMRLQLGFGVDTGYESCGDFTRMYSRSSSSPVPSHHCQCHRRRMIPDCFGCSVAIERDTVDQLRQVRVCALSESMKKGCLGLRIDR